MNPIAVCLALVVPASSWASEAEDPYLWLEDVEAEASLAWARERNAETLEVFSEDEGFQALQTRLQGIYDSDDRIASPYQMGDGWYNFWRDADHPRGIWRMTTRERYLSGSPEWETVIDVDALGEAEGVSWVWRGADCLYPEYRRCMVRLSRGGADAVVVREFDTETMAFVEDGFTLPEAKGGVGWIDVDTLYVSTDFGEGTLTDSGYPRQVRRWSRGTSFKEAELVYEGQISDVGVSAFHNHRPGYEYDMVTRNTSFFTNESYLLTKRGLQKVEKPDSANVRVWRDRFLFEPRDDWTVGGTTYVQGSLLTAPVKRWMKGKRELEVLFEPSDTRSLQGFTGTRDHLVLSILDTVRDEMEVLTPQRKAWSRRKISVGGEGLLRRSVRSVDRFASNELFASVSGYTTPSSLWLIDEPGGAGTKMRSLPEMFSAEGLVVTQHLATSKDGTKIPYFQVAREDLELNGEHKTLLYGYGGFEVSLRPWYSATIGASWLEKGGVYVVANIRGGGEFGPRWHQAALKANRHKAYEDFAAVGEDLVARGVTAPERLGIRGGSNGGLLMGNMLSMYPEHWGAIVCSVPLLDMRRYHTLLAGASWMDEFGNPDNPEEWSFLQNYSPYHTVDVEAVDYPPILFTTSTRDDRVHPAHARKMVARMLEGGEDGVFYYENIEGGHGGAANNKQRAFVDALWLTFLARTLSQ